MTTQLDNQPTGEENRKFLANKKIYLSGCFCISKLLLKGFIIYNFYFKLIIFIFRLF
jgi:hypothetical protein